MILCNRQLNNSTSGRIRLLHLITGLKSGGAETMLYKLLTSTDFTRFEPYVISLMDRRILGKQIEKLGIPVYTLGMRRRGFNPLKLYHLHRVIRSLKPDLIQSWMYHANLIATLTSQLNFTRIPVIWNIRQSLYNLKTEKQRTAYMIRLGAWLSQQPNRIFYNSRVSAHQHQAVGYAAIREQVIPNGFDCDRFRPSELARLKLRRELGLAEDTLLIGLVARYHPMKDHANFIRAAGQLIQQYPDVHFILVGRDITEQNIVLQKEIQSIGLKNIHQLGEQNDIPQITAALDIATSSSWSEAFPNVIGEAMACGVSCVVTDVGDSAWIVDKTGQVVPPRDSQALAEGWMRLIEMGSEGRKKLGTIARQRILGKFSLPKIVQQYEAIYDEVLRETKQM